MNSHNNYHVYRREREKREGEESVGTRALSFKCDRVLVDVLVPCDRYLSVCTENSWLYIQT